MTREEMIDRATDAILSRRDKYKQPELNALQREFAREDATAALEAVGAWAHLVTLETIRDLHRPVHSGAYCVLCDEMVEPSYPCSTVRAVRLVLGGV